MQVVIFCGGESLRFSNQFIKTNKTMSLIGGKPLLWHILNYFSKFGLNDFIICVKDNDTEIKNYFRKNNENWKINVLQTGNHSSTGKRLKKCEPLITEDLFLATYGDGLSDINLYNLIEFHQNNNALATLSAFKPINPFGVLQITNNHQIVDFTEKPLMDVWVNGGFFVFNKAIFHHLKKNQPLETGLLKELSRLRLLNAFKHSGNWKSMDTFKDYIELCDMWDKNTYFW